MCLRGSSEVENVILAHEPSVELAAYVAWVPELGAQPKDVPGGMGLVPDTRALHYWDAQELLGRAYERILPTPGPAWDVYLLFGRGVRWSGATPPKPAYWMHQLGGVTSGPRLDPDVLRDHVGQLLRG
jgi:hypothetical protein